MLGRPDQQGQLVLQRRAGLRAAKADPTCLSATGGRCIHTSTWPGKAKKARKEDSVPFKVYVYDEAKGWKSSRCEEIGWTMGILWVLKRKRARLK